MRVFFLLLTLTILLGSFVLKPFTPPVANTPPNVLFIVADDWSFPHAGSYGDPVARTPNFDRLASEGILFTNAHCTAPSCTPSRAAVLTGHYPHTLREGTNLWGSLPVEFATYPGLLNQAGYVIGSFSKGWGPGDFTVGGYASNPAGPETKDYRQFFKDLPAEKPFCFWLGTYDPHRPYDAGSGRKASFDPAKVVVPPYLPDVSTVREDIADYLTEVERFDTMVGDAVHLLDSLSRLDNTLVIVTSDNGMPFPRAKARLYDAGTHIPLAIWWKNKIKAGQRTNELVNLLDVAPTILAATGQPIPTTMNGLNLWPLLTGKTTRTQPAIFMERERHANARTGNVGYPARALRTQDFLYIANLRSQRTPAGDSAYAGPQGSYNDIDNGPTKVLMLTQRDKPAIKPFFEPSFGQVPAEELFDLRKDPATLTNVATRPEYASVRQRLSQQLRTWMTRTNDPRLNGKGDEIDQYPYYGKLH